MQKEHLQNASIQADDPGIEPEDTKCCGKRGNSEANVGGREHGEEVEHGLMEAGVCDHYIQDGAYANIKGCLAKIFPRQSNLDDLVGLILCP